MESRNESTHPLLILLLLGATLDHVCCGASPLLIELLPNGLAKLELFFGLITIGGSLISPLIG